jgi:hypothetical protein
MNESRAQNWTHTCPSSVILCTQSSHHTVQRCEDFGQHTRVSLFGNCNEATLNRNFTVNNIICLAQLIVLPTPPKVSMQLHSRVPKCLNLSSLKNELLHMTCSKLCTYMLQNRWPHFERLGKRQDFRSVPRML